MDIGDVTWGSSWKGKRKGIKGTTVNLQKSTPATEQIADKLMTLIMANLSKKDVFLQKLGLQAAAAEGSLHPCNTCGPLRMAQLV